ncbi:MAG: hypothetical protein KJ749_06425, partial [Planctomycetes bacterium]|nr:hypothetical protein [Planctomycetota bacterium]
MAKIVWAASELSTGLARDLANKPSKPGNTNLVDVFTCENLTKRYGRIVALSSVTLSVEPGLVGLLGPNGA